MYPYTEAKGLILVHVMPKDIPMRLNLLSQHDFRSGDDDGQRWSC